MTTAAPHIVEAVNELNRRLAPAKLKDSQRNAATLFGWLTELGVNPMAVTASELADYLEKQIKAHLFEKQLDWQILPKALAAEKALAGPAKFESAVKSENALRDRQKIDEARIAYEKKQKEAEQRINLLIENFMPLNTRGTATDHIQQERVQTYLRKYVDQARERKADMVKIAEFVATTIAEEYTKLERRNQFSGSGSANSTRTSSREW